MNYKLKIYSIIVGMRKPENAVQLIHASILKWLGIARPSVMVMLAGRCE